MTTYPTAVPVIPGDALTAQHPEMAGADVIDLAAEQRWTRWKLEGRRLDAVRAGRVRILFAAAGVASIAWLLLNL